MADTKTLIIGMADTQTLIFSSYEGINEYKYYFDVKDGALRLSPEGRKDF